MAKAIKELDKCKRPQQSQEVETFKEWKVTWECEEEEEEVLEGNNDNRQAKRLKASKTPPKMRSTPVRNKKANKGNNKDSTAKPQKMKRVTREVSKDFDTSKSRFKI